MKKEKNLNDNALNEKAEQNEDKAISENAMQNEDIASNGNLAQNAVLSDSQHSAELLKRIEKGFTVRPMPIAQKGERLLKTNCVCFFVLSSLSSLSAKVTFAELYRDKNNDFYFSAKGAIPKKR